MRLIVLTLVAALALPAAAQESRPDYGDFVIARLFAEDGDFGAALDRMDRVVEKNPGDPVVLFERAMILLDAGKFERAENDLRKIVNADPNFYDARKLLGRVLLDRSRGNRERVEEALGHLRAAFDMDPDDLGTGLTISQILVSFGQTTEAERVLTTLAERYPDHRAVNYQYALVLTKLGRAEESRKYLERVVDVDPTYGAAVFQLVEIYQQAKEWEKAAQVLMPMIEAEPLNLDLKRQRAYFLLRGGKSEEARARFEEILKLDPKDDRVRFFLAEALSDLEHLEEAEKIYRELLVKSPNEPDYLVSFGLNLLGQRKYDDAAAAFKTLLEQNGLQSSIRNRAETQLAAIEHFRGNYDVALERALAVLQKALQLNTQAMNIALDVYRRKKDYASASALVEKAIREFGTDPYLGARQVEFLVRAEKLKEAESIAAAQVKSGRRGALAIAEAYMQLEKYDRGIAILEKLRAETPDDIDILFQLGASLERADRVPEAEKVFLSILDRQARHSPTQNYLGYMWADRNVNLDRAATMLIDAVAQEPRNGAYVDSLGWVYFRMGKLDLAEKYLTQAAEILPRDATVQEHLGDLFARKGHWKLAAEKYRVALDLGPDETDEAELKTKIADAEQKGEPAK
ncbi:MAG: tetratricopeptide repeat protein [Thermoanaerobaculia bacterium]